MSIVCTTTLSAAEVLFLFLSDGMNLRSDFTIWPVLSSTPPLIFTIVAVLTAAQEEKIRAIPDTTVT